MRFDVARFVGTLLLFAGVWYVATEIDRLLRRPERFSVTFDTL